METRAPSPVHAIRGRDDRKLLTLIDAGQITFAIVVSTGVIVTPVNARPATGRKCVKAM